MKSNILLAAAAAVLLAIGGLLAFLPKEEETVGSAVISTTQAIYKAAGLIAGAEGLTVGTSGTNIDRINTGTCYIKAYAASIAASSSASVDCQANDDVDAGGIAALTGVTFGDIVVANLSTTTASDTFGGIYIKGAAASTTPGYITLEIVNLTGTTFTWPTTGTATGTASYIATDI